MAFQPAPGVIEITCNHVLFGRPVVNVFHVKGGTTVSDVQLETVADSVINSWATNVMPVFSNDLLFTDVECRDLTAEGGHAHAVTAGTGVAGGFAGASLPGNVAFCLTLRTARVGRSYRGRKYFAGLPETHVTANQFLDTRAAALRTAFEAVLDTLAEGDWTGVVLSRVNGGVERAVAEATPITAIIVRDLKVDTMRRRAG